MDDDGRDETSAIAEDSRDGVGEEHQGTAMPRARARTVSRLAGSIAPTLIAKENPIGTTSAMNSVSWPTKTANISPDFIRGR